MFMICAKSLFKCLRYNVVYKFCTLTGLNWNDLPLDNRFNESFSHEYHLERENIYSKELNLPASRRVKRAVVRPILSPDLYVRS